MPLCILAILGFIGSAKVFGHRQVWPIFYVFGFHVFLGTIGEASPRKQRGKVKIVTCETTIG